MKFVLDTNVILKALIKNSSVRAIIVGSKHEFSIPREAIEEIRRHAPLVKEKSGLSEMEINSVLDTLLTSVQLIQTEEDAAERKEAEDIMLSIDKDDAPFLAAAMGIVCDGIWSDDKHLKRQTRVRVWTTKEILALN